MKIPPKTPQFFKPIQKGFKNGIKIPTGFLKYLKGQDHIEHAILRRAGKTWLVKVNGWRLEHGWKKFVKENDLQLGYLLIFKHEGDMEFEVSIFDSSHCDREYAEYVQQETGCNNVEEASKHFESKGKSNLCITSSDKAFPRAEAGTYNPCGKSRFECIVNPYCISRSFLRIPTQFAKENGLINKKCGVIIKDERQRSWNLRLATLSSRVHILGGWSKLRIANDLKEGDHMMFEVIANGEKPIWKFRSKPNPNIVSTRKASLKKESATYSSFHQSHLVCIVRPYCLSKNYLCLPQRFAHANGLINKKCGVIIKDERERSWNLRLATHDSRVHLLGGWHEVCIANDLKEGDHMMFEVIANGEKPIWKFRKAAIHTSWGQSHFECIARPYCISNGFLRLPKQFAMANGLFNKKRDLIIRDERQRLWNLRLANFGSSVRVFDGWNDFCTANNLQEGDYMMFEVVSNGEKPIWKFHSTTDLRHKTSDVATPISQTPASTSANANPYFISTIKRYTFTKAILYLPMDFVKSNGLMSRREVILVDEMQRSWSVCLGQMGRHFGIRSGWAQFRKANNVQEGDTYKFELTNNGKIPLVHVS